MRLIGGDFEEAIRQRQSEVAVQGNEWEQFVANFLRRHLPPEYGVFLKPKPSSDVGRLFTISYPTNLWNEFDLTEINDNTPIFGDVDIGVVKDDRAIVVVSCKLSLHNRLTETLFYSLLYHQKGIRIVLATPDKGQSGRSEWGTPERPTKNRLLARRFLSGVYIHYETGLFPIPRVRAGFGDIVRPLEELPKDIQRWFP